MTGNILIYESNSGGHRTEFVEYMLDYLTESTSDEDCFFLINSKIYEAIATTITEAEKNNKTLTVFKLPVDVEEKLKAEPSALKRSLFEKKMLNTYFEKYSISKLVMLEFDSYQYIIGSWANSKFSKIQVNAILYNPYVQGLASESGFKAKIKHLRKEFQLRWSLRNKGINSIYVLNDITGVKELNNIMGVQSHFKHLPDPLKVRSYNKIDIRSKYKIDANKKILLLVGGVQRRKNTLNVINAVEALDKDLAADSCLLILGKCFDDQLLSEIETLIASCKNCQIIFENKLLDSDEFESAVEEAYLMFTVYIDTFSSSGIVNHAAKHGKCTIACKNGVIGYVTKKYNLGVIVDPASNKEITNAITACLNEENIDRYNKDFVNERDHKKFAEALLKFN